MEQTEDILRPAVESLGDGRARMVLDDVSYTFTLANAETGWKAFKSAMAVMKDAKKDASILGTILGSLGHPSVDNVEKLVRSNTVVEVPGEKPFRLNDRFDEHFNKHRRHMIKVLLEGVKYQFGDFFDSSALGL